MPTLNKVPFISLMLLLAAYVTLGWFLDDTGAPVLVWVLVAFLACAQAGILTILWRGVKTLTNRWLKSEIGYFALILSSAFLAAVAVVWIRISVHILVIIAAGLLTRIDTLTLKLSKFHAFLILLAVPLIGLASTWIFRNLL
ncbi:MAG: hypothetical protein F6K19_01945 [Cyanothece sp. SIO1E1]|nr:hypothetical protein [Cyanothece sp. SIO1E1]